MANSLYIAGVKQTASILVSFTDENGEKFVVLTRNSNNLTQPGRFMFSGGKVFHDEVSNHNKSKLNKIPEISHNPHVIAALRILQEETSIDATKYLKKKDCKFGLVSKLESKGNSQFGPVAMKIYKLYLGKLNKEEIDLLKQEIKPGSDVSIIAVVPLNQIKNLNVEGKYGKFEVNVNDPNCFVKVMGVHEAYKTKNGILMRTINHIIQDLQNGKKIISKDITINSLKEKTVKKNYKKNKYSSHSIQKAKNNLFISKMALGLSASVGPAITIGLSFTNPLFSMPFGAATIILVTLSAAKFKKAIKKLKVSMQDNSETNKIHYMVYQDHNHNNFHRDKVLKNNKTKLDEKYNKMVANKSNYIM